MKKQFLFVLGVILLTALHTSCSVEEYDMDKLSMDSLMLETSVDVPFASVDLTLKDVFLHRGSKGKFITEDASYNIAEITEEEQVPLPSIVVKETSIIALDSLTDVAFKDGFGPGKVLDSIIEARLKFDVRNELPFDIDITVHFVCQDSFIVTTRPLVYEERKYISESLDRSIHVDGSDIDSKNRKLVSATTCRQEIKFLPEDNEELIKVTDIIFEYQLNLPVNKAFVSKDYKLSTKMSAFLRANLSLTD